MAKKKMDKKTPKENHNSISYWIYVYLKKGVSCREELIYNICKNFKNNKVNKNSKNRDINVKSVINNVNEVLKYFFNNRHGWYSNYKLIDNKDELKIVNKPKTIEKISEVNLGGKHKNTLLNKGRESTV